jgi:hypothetical protein
MELCRISSKISVRTHDEMHTPEGSGYVVRNLEMIWSGAFGWHAILPQLHHDDLGRVIHKKRNAIV